MPAPLAGRTPPGTFGQISPPISIVKYGYGKDGFDDDDVGRDERS